MRDELRTEQPVGARVRRTAYRSEQQRWAAVVRRDADADGKFFYSVKTTGVYCRPSCAARRALRENVAFHDTCAEAERAGFRPCKRCQPNGPTIEEHYAEKIAEACRFIESTEEPLSLSNLSKRVGVSAFHFHRLFKRIVGLTPKAYASAHRAELLRRALRRRGSVTEAIYAAGFKSSGRFYEKSAEMLGMAANRFRRGGTGETIRHAVVKCSLGFVLVAASEKGVCSILLGDDRSALVRELQLRFSRARLREGDRTFKRVVAKVVRLIEKPRASFELPLDVRGTAFQQRVWQALREIPPGETTSYTEIAKRIGDPKAVRAVAGACAANAIAVAIPCHRVLRRDGQLSGYRWGVERKRALLKREAASRRA